ncbi:hypothetical protein L873DRAFT_1633133, partial [Choiromyces venosus 120613-1]
KTQAGENAGFEDVFTCLESPHEYDNGASKRVRFSTDAPDAKKLLDLSMCDLDHRDMPWADIAKEAKVKAARSTIENLFYSHNVVRYVARLKPLLIEKMRDERVDLTKLGITIDIRRIVFTDEMWIEFNSSRCKTHQVRIRGENPYDAAKAKKDDAATIRLMFWSGINILLVPAPGYIHPKVNEDDKKHQQDIQQEVNRIQQKQGEEKVILGYQEGTEEYHEVEVMNKTID